MGQTARRSDKKAEKRRRREREVRKMRARQRGQESSAPRALQEKAMTELPVHECLISKGWKGRGLAHILLSRQRADGNLAVAGYYVDTLCLGLKDTALMPSVSVEEYETQVKTGLFHDQVELESCDPRIARAIVEGAIAFSGQFGFRPNKRWDQAKRLLEGIEAKTKGLVFGREGKPCLVLRKAENLLGPRRRLERTLAPGEYVVEEGDSLR